MELEMLIKVWYLVLFGICLVNTNWVNGLVFGIPPFKGIPITIPTFLPFKDNKCE